jgi:hypothetical protein
MGGKGRNWTDNGIKQSLMNINKVELVITCPSYRTFTAFFPIMSPPSRCFAGSCFITFEIAS